MKKPYRPDCRTQWMSGFTLIELMNSSTPISVDRSHLGQDGRRAHINLVGRSKPHRPDDADSSRRPSCP